MGDRLFLSGVLVAMGAGWGMIASECGRLWVWFIPLALGLLTLANMWFLLAPVFGWYDVTELIRDPPYYQVFTVGLHLAYALAVLALGLSLLGRRADPARGGWRGAAPRSSPRGRLVSEKVIV